MIKELSIVIPTLNEAEYLPKLLDSLVLQNFTGKLQVVVVDGESEDDTIKIAKKYSKKFDDLLVLSTKRDIGSQRNFGAKYAKYEYLLFLDADVIMPADTLNKLSHKVKQNGLFVGSIKHEFKDKTPSETVFYYVGYAFYYILLLLRFPMTNGDFINLKI